MEIVADIAEVHRTLCKVAAVMMGPKMALGRAQAAQASFFWGYLNILSRHVFVGFLCGSKHKTDCNRGHNIDGRDMLYYIMPQYLNRLGLTGEDISSRRYVGILMIRKNAIVFLIMLAVSSVGIVFAGDIYKWTDEDGNVHYGDHPTSEVSEEPLAVNSGLTDPSRVQARHEAKAAAIEPAEPAPKELRAQALEREEKCATSKARLQKFLTSRRLYSQDEYGERVYLDQNETLAARERVQNQVEEYCDS